MHKYLKAIGFTELKKKQGIREILKQTADEFDLQRAVSLDETSEIFVSSKKQYGDNVGISVYGEMDQDKIFEREYYVPYFEGSGITTYADVLVERRIEKEMYVGICEDVKVGASIIFHIQNAIEYMKEKQLGGLAKKTTSVTLSGLGSSGMILFPISKDEHLEKTRKEEERNRMMLLSAARNGDQEAMESLTLDDIDTYSKVSKRLITEDIFTIVETYFMPYGVECDEYSILGEIIDLRKTQNKVTQETLYIMTLDVNELQFDVCIPEKEVMEFRKLEDDSKEISGFKEKSSFLKTLHNISHSW